MLIAMGSAHIGLNQRSQALTRKYTPRKTKPELKILFCTSKITHNSEGWVW